MVEAPELKGQKDSMSGLMRGSGLLRGAMGSKGPTSVMRPLSKVRWSVNCGTFVELASTVGPQLKGAILPLNRCVFCVRGISLTSVTSLARLCRFSSDLCCEIYSPNLSILFRRDFVVWQVHPT